MLSVIDLVAAGTIDQALAAYLIAAMRRGVSLLVGANPGGAGKTTVMCALLDFLPGPVRICTVSGRSVLQAARETLQHGSVCYLAHEINNAFYYAYLWGEDARDYFDLVLNGDLIASNLHADTLEQTYEKLCHGSGVSAKALEAVALKIYLRVSRGTGWRTVRQIDTVYEYDQPLWRLDGGRQVQGELVTEEQEASAARLLTELTRRGINRIEEVRRFALAADGGHDDN